MRKTWLIIQREYLTRVRKRIFIITTLLAPLGLGLITLLPLLLSRVSSEDQRIGVIDRTGIFQDKLEDERTIKFKYLNDTYEYAKKNYQDQGLSGILYVRPDFDLYSGTGVEYFSDQQLGLRAQGAITSQMSRITRTVKLAKRDLTPELIDELSKDVEIKAIVLSATGEKESNTGIATAIGYVMGFVIYIVMLLYGSLVMRGVMEEKTNRIAEVMISSVRPFQLMMGKILGIGAVGLTQFLIWIVLISGISLLLASLIPHDVLLQAQQTGQQLPGSMQQGSEAIRNIAEAQVGLSSINWGLVVFCFVFFFLGGYLFYAALFAAVGSAVNEDPQDAQSLMMPITIPIVLGIIIMINAINDPSGPLATWSSIIPFFSPIVMMARIPFGVPDTVPYWQLGLSMALLVGGFLATTWLSARIYRTGILLYGKKPSLKELAKWVRRR
jgi:ABC-2 type transport system permease protein